MKQHTVVIIIVILLFVAGTFGQNLFGVEPLVPLPKLPLDDMLNLIKPPPGSMGNSAWTPRPHREHGCGLRRINPKQYHPFKGKGTYSSSLTYNPYPMLAREANTPGVYSINLPELLNLRDSIGIEQESRGELDRLIYQATLPNSSSRVPLAGYERR